MTNRTNKALIKNSFGSSRYGGILLHPTSLPGKYGIGDFGVESYEFIDYLHKYRQNLWQILPLGPTGYGNSPYQSFSAFAGNPILISPDNLIELGLLPTIESEESFSNLKTEYGRIIPFKWNLLEIAFRNFLKKIPPVLNHEFAEFKKENRYWLDDYSLFMSIKLQHEMISWSEWEDGLRTRDKNSLENWFKDYSEEIEFHKFTQFIFFRQWNKLKEYANQKQIKIIGDIPIFVAYDSVDVWAHSESYYLDENKQLLYVAGVPPDYFSATGQRWGNPLYKWDFMKKQGYKWWIERIRHSFNQVDILRIDHFRGFESYWQIDASEETAVVGKWVPGPGIDLFLALNKALGPLPIIAEDLGLITPEVEELLKQTGFPGMRVLQFGFIELNDNSSENKYLPHNFETNSIVYTGTHDNQTTKAWFETMTEEIKREIIKYSNSNGKDIVGDMIRLAWSSIAKMAVVPLQDILRLGDEARMNFPGTTGNNWEWRFSWNQLTKKKGRELRKLNIKFKRIL